MYEILIFFHFLIFVKVFLLNSTKTCKMTKILLVIFSFNLITIFNSIRYLKQNENSIH